MFNRIGKSFSKNDQDRLSSINVESDAENVLSVSHVKQVDIRKSVKYKDEEEDQESAEQIMVVDPGAQLSKEQLIALGDPHGTDAKPESQQEQDQDEEDQLDFYAELEQIIRQENLQADQLTGQDLHSGSVATLALNQQAMKRAKKDKRHYKIFRLMNEGQLGSHHNARVWPKDAAGEILSHTKMEYVLKQRQVRQRIKVDKSSKDRSSLADLDEFESMKFPVCSTNTGWFPFLCCNKSTHSDIADELGLGISIYFKQLKYLTMMLIVCTILSIPAYMLYWSGNKRQDSFSFEDPKSFFSTFTLGNLGQSSLQCVSSPVQRQGRQYSLESNILCPFGVARQLFMVIPASSDEYSCHQNEEDFIFTNIDPERAQLCDIREQIESTDQWDDCIGRSFCSLSFKAQEYPGDPSCIDEQAENMSLFVLIGCDGSDITVPGGYEISRENLAAIVMVLDVVICFWFIMNIAMMSSYIEREGKYMDDQYVTMPDFAVKIKNLPPRSEYKDLNQLRAQLTLHINKVVKKEPQFYQNLRDSPDSPEEVVNIHFAQKNFENYRILMKIEDLARVGQRKRTLMRRTEDKELRDKLEKEIDVIKNKVMLLTRDYKNIDPHIIEGHIKNAYITMKSMEGAARLIQAYQLSRWKRFWLSVCCSRSRYKERLFQGRWLQAERAIEPSLIMWENLGFSKKMRCLRILGSVFITMIMLSVTVIAIMYARVADEELQSFSPQVNCGEASENISEQQALWDYSQKSDVDKEGLLYCYCKNKVFDALKDGDDPWAAMKEPFSDGNAYCEDWWQKYLISNALVCVIPFVIIFISWVSKTILRIVTQFEKRQSKPEEVYASTINMYLLGFVNAGVILLLVNFRLNNEELLSFVPDNFPFLRGTYTKFSVEWYRLVGSTICITMLLLIVSPNGSNIGFQCMFGCLRCWDRRCTCDRRRTRKLIQQDYEDINTGNELMLEFRYSNMLIVLSLVLFYSSGIPILYPMAALFFLITYMTDKWLLLRYYRKPPKFNCYLARKTLVWFKYMLVLHVIGAILMFSNSSILPYRENIRKKSLDEQLDSFSHETYSNTEFLSIRMIAYQLIFVVVVLFYFFWRYAVKLCLKICKCCCQSDVAENLTKTENVRSNFYSCVSFRTLRQELYMAQNNVKIFKSMYNTGNYLQKKMKPQDLLQYIQILEPQNFFFGVKSFLYFKDKFLIA